MRTARRRGRCSRICVSCRRRTAAPATTDATLILARRRPGRPPSREPITMTSQCPSTKGKKAPPEARELARLNGRGPKVWRSVDEFAGDPGFLDFVQREFPKGASELLGEE